MPLRVPHEYPAVPWCDYSEYPSAHSPLRYDLRVCVCVCMLRYIYGNITTHPHTSTHARLLVHTCAGTMWAHPAHICAGICMGSPPTAHICAGTTWAHPAHRLTSGYSGVFVRTRAAGFSCGRTIHIFIRVRACVRIYLLHLGIHIYICPSNYRSVCL